MDKRKLRLVLIIVLGGAAVLASYAYGILAQPGAGEILWGGVPGSLRTLYTVNMFLGAAGFFAFSFFLLFRVNAQDARVFKRFGYGAFHLLYLLILLPSALWLPLTAWAVGQSSPLLAWAARLDLAVVALASIALLLALLGIAPRPASRAHKLAVAGGIFFCLQTVVLDAVVWAAYFSV